MRIHSGGLSKQSFFAELTSYSTAEGTLGKMWSIKLLGKTLFPYQCTVEQSRSHGISILHTNKRTEFTHL